MTKWLPLPQCSGHSAKYNQQFAGQQQRQAQASSLQKPAGQNRHELDGTAWEIQMPLLKKPLNCKGTTSPPQRGSQLLPAEGKRQPDGAQPYWSCLLPAQAASTRSRERAAGLPAAGGIPRGRTAPAPDTEMGGHQTHSSLPRLPRAATDGSSISQYSRPHPRPHLGKRGQCSAPRKEAAAAAGSGERARQAASRLMPLQHCRPFLPARRRAANSQLPPRPAPRRRALTPLPPPNFPLQGRGAPRAVTSRWERDGGCPRPGTPAAGAEPPTRLPPTFAGGRRCAAFQAPPGWSRQRPPGIPERSQPRRGPAAVAGSRMGPPLRRAQPPRPAASRPLAASTPGQVPPGALPQRRGG